MKLFGRSKPTAPKRRVTDAGRTNPYAYYSQRSAEPSVQGRQVFREALSARNAKRAAHFWAQRFGLLLVIITLIIATVNLLSLSTDPKVMPVDAQSGAFLHPMSDYEKAAQQLFNGSLLNHNKLTVDTAGISVKLKQQFPELSVVNITLPLVGHRPIMYIAQAEPALLLQTANGHGYIVDTAGRVIGTASTTAAASLHLLNVHDASDTSLSVGQLAVSSDTVAFIESVQYQISQKGLSASSYVLPAGTSELDMYLDGKQYFVKFNLVSNDIMQQVGAFLAVKHNLEGRGTTPSSYIDVRVDGRAYYK